jgi:hypothetical protein
MKTFFKPIVSILAVASLLAAGGAFAQQMQQHQTQSNGGRDWHKGPPSVEEKLARISAALDLSDEQSAEMLATLQLQERIKSERHDRIMALMGDEICAERNRIEAEILAILDTEQAELFLQMKEDRQQLRTNHRNRARNGDEALDCSGYEGGDS